MSCKTILYFIYLFSAVQHGDQVTHTRVHTFSSHCCVDIALNAAQQDLIVNPFQELSVELIKVVLVLHQSCRIFHRYFIDVRLRKCRTPTAPLLRFIMYISILKMASELPGALMVKDLTLSLLPLQFDPGLGNSACCGRGQKKKDIFVISLMIYLDL